MNVSFKFNFILVIPIKPTFSFIWCLHSINGIFAWFKSCYRIIFGFFLLLSTARPLTRYGPDLCYVANYWIEVFIVIWIMLYSLFPCLAYVFVHYGIISFLVYLPFELLQFLFWHIYYSCWTWFKFNSALLILQWCVLFMDYFWILPFTFDCQM